ncbi:MAG: YdcF family protein [Armatimonadetes bacterium]|nr:YdcF family protein [Armatimonadota bacterium]
MALTGALCMVGFPLAQIYCFGKTDYRRPADAVVVFGARAFKNGHCSRALRDRVRTGCQLYLDGLAHTLIFSGGPGDGAITEPEAMRRYALRLGVPDKDILLDPEGLDTEATAKNTCLLFTEHNLRRVMAVSHFYHLPRIKMTYRRHGWDVYTVPAQESRVLVRMPYYMMREVAALWVYYLRPLV